MQTSITAQATTNPIVGNDGNSQLVACVLAQFPGRIALTLREFARAIGSTENSVRARLSTGKLEIRTIKIGKSRLIPINEVVNFVSTRCDHHAASATNRLFPK